MILKILEKLKRHPAVFFISICLKLLKNFKYISWKYVN